MSKRLLIVLLPVVLVFGTLIGVYFYFKPKMQSWILGQVTRLSDEKLPVNLKIESVNWTLLFPEVQVEGVSISPKPGDLKDLPPIEIKKVSASLDIFAIFTGRLAVSSLLIDSPTTVIQLDPFLKDTGPSKPLPMDMLFEYLPKIPISRLGLKAADITIISEKQQLNVHLKETDILVMNRRNRVQLQFDSNESTFLFEKTEIPFRLQGEATLNRQSLDLNNVKLGALNSLVTMSGSLEDFARIHMEPKGTVEYEVFSDLEAFYIASTEYFKMPSLSGSIKSSGRLQLADMDKTVAGFKVLGQKIKIDQFDVGDIQFEGQFAKNLLSFSDIALTNEAGLLDVKGLQIEFGKKEGKTALDLRGKILSDQIDMNELMIRIGVGDIPVEGFISADISCQGAILPALEMKCQGSTDAEQFEVRSGPRPEDLIVSVDEFGAKGDFTVTQQGVKYQAKVHVKEDQGTSDGFVSFKEGFKINFATPELHFKNIQHLAGLKLEGSGALNGSTQGDSQAATFQMTLSPKEFFFDNFYLGDVTGKMRYDSGRMYFTEMAGKVGSSAYSANVTVDLNKKRISAKADLPQYELTDVFKIFERIYKMPVEITGTGKASATVEGPFQIGRLSYDLNTTIFRGMAVGESFDRAEFHLISNSGEMKVNNGKLTKNKTDFVMTGVSHPDGQIDLKVVGGKFPLEESENISKLGAQINGLLDVNIALTGHVLNAETDVKGRIYQLNVEEQDFPESTFELDVTKQLLKGKTNLFTGQLLADFAFPLVDGQPFKLDLNAKNWNYATLFTLIGGGNLLNDYNARMTGDLQLASPSGGMWASTGKGTIQNFILQRGNLSLQNKQPMILEMKSGLISLTNFRLDGDQTFFDVKGKEFSKDQLNVHIDGKANLRLFQIFVPFLEEFAGTANISIDTSGSLSKPEVLGNAKVSGGFIKIKGFPHPFEKTQADIQFSQSKILVDGIKGTIAGGTFEGGGTVGIEGPRNFPTNIRARLDNVNFNVPDQIRTSGNADMTFAGSWFPFTLSGTYHVTGGFMDKEFGGGETANSLRASSYLPKIILQSAFEPVLLDLNILIERPLTIKNSLIDGSALGNLAVRGAPTQPALSGRIVLEPGSKILIRDKTFDVQAASVQFTGSTEINPDLYLTAKSRITEYDINILAQGSAKNPQLRFSSVPPLAERDIVSLMALGVTSQSLERQVENSQKNKSNSSGENLAAAVGGMLFQQGDLKDLQDRTGVQVQVSSSYDDTKNVSVQKFTLSKKLSDRVKASATQTAGSQTGREYSLQYNLTDNVSAIGRYEDRQPSQNSGTVDSAARESQSIFGIDLEFKKEFK